MDSDHGDSDASAGHLCPAAGAPNCPSLPAGAPAGTAVGNFPQFHFIPVPVEKVPAVLQVLAPCGGGEATTGEGTVLPDGHGSSEADSSGSIWAKARGPIAGLVLFATATAAALGSVATLGHYCHPHHGANHGVHHATHSPKGRRRPLSGTDGADNDAKPDDGGAAGSGDGVECVHVHWVDWCEHRIDDCVCRLRVRRCRWWNGGGQVALEHKIDGLTSTLTSGLQDLKREVVACREDYRELRAAKNCLEQMQGEGLFGFVQKIDRQTLDVFFRILASGDIAKASRALDMNDSTLRSQVAGWRQRGKPYRALAEFVRWRKSIRGKAGIDFAKRLASGAERDVDHAGLIRDLIEELEDFNPENWEEKCQSLAEALRKAVS
jgi:hypothetical protein